MQKPKLDRDAAFHQAGLTPDRFWQLPLADRDWLWPALGVTENVGRRLLQMVGAETVKVGVRTFVFPRRLAQQFDELLNGADRGQ